MMVRTLHKVPRIEGCGGLAVYGVRFWAFVSLEGIGKGGSGFGLGFNFLDLRI